MLPSSSPRLYTLHSTPSNQLRVHNGFILYLNYIYYEITIRLVYDNYVIQTTSMEHVQTRITSTASATTSYHIQFLPAQTAISAKSAQKYVV